MMTRKPKVSILVPIYNVDKYLRECLDSIIAQTLQDIEIICINDGSTDNSLAIIKEYAADDPRIIIINKKNSGYGDSMNRGLQRATGTYIGIVESDDFVDSQMFEELYRLAEENKVDVVKSNFYHYTSAGGNVLFHLVNPDEINRIINPREYHHIFLQMPSIWSGLYRRDFLIKHDIKFLPTAGASYQDTSFNFKIWASTKKVLFTDRAFLHYRIDNESSSINSRAKAFCVTEELHEMEKFLREHNLLGELGGILAQRRFDIYYWNLERLSGYNARDFLTTMSEELNRDEENGLLDRSMLARKANWQRDQIAYNPRRFWTIEKVRHVLARAKKAISRVLNVIFPSRRKQQYFIAVSEDLARINRDLVAKINDLDNRVLIREEKRRQK